MSANATNSRTASTSSNIQPSLDGLMITHTFLVLLLPLTVGLFHFSTPQSRRQPLFILNVAAVFLAFVQCVLTDAYAIRSILEPSNPWPLAWNVIIGAITIIQYYTVDVTLLVRLITVYPLSDLGRFRFSLFAGIPVLLKIIRAVNFVLLIKAMIVALHGPNPGMLMGIVFTKKPYMKIEWGAQMIDNTYASVGFLWRIRSHGSRPVITNSSRVSMLTQRMRTLFRMAIANFVFPAMISIAQIVCVYHGVDPVTLNQLMQVNTMLATFGVSFATVWAGNAKRREGKGSRQQNTTSRLMVIFGASGGRENHGSTTVIPDQEYKMDKMDSHEKLSA